jgi:hypothetical protein
MLRDKRIWFVVEWMHSATDSLPFEADVRAREQGEARRKFKQVFPKCHIVRVRRALEKGTK